MAVLVAALVIFVAAGLLTALLGESLLNLSGEAPRYQEAVNSRVEEFFAWLSTRGLLLEAGIVDDALNPQRLLAIVADLFNALRSLMANAIVILMLVVFSLLEFEKSEGLMVRAFGPESSIPERMSSYAQQVVNYMGVKTVMSLGTGAAVTSSLWLLGVDHPLLWGTLAFLLNYIPIIGSLIAAVPPVFLSLVVDGWGKALAVAAVIIIIINVFSNFLEPKMMGRKFGISPVIVLVAILFWPWVLGPVGLILAVPLTVALKLALESGDDTRWMAMLMG